VVIVVRRESGDEGLLVDDKDFIEYELKPHLEDIARESGGLAGFDDVANDAAADGAEPAKPLVSRIRTFSDRNIGLFFESNDNKATLVVLELTTEFSEKRNHELISRIEQLIGPDGPLQTEQIIPSGLDLNLSGPATVGRDMRQAARASADASHLWTVILVIVLLLAIYRAPVMALIPLVTVYVSAKIAVLLLALLARQGAVDLFNGIEIYVTVVLYGAGVDYCMFLMARYREELDAGASLDEAIAGAVGKVGAAIAASAGTVIGGIGMMVFAEFDKFRQAGVALSFSLLFVLLASLTFAPALLRLVGRWAFWPHMQTERLRGGQGWLSPTNLAARLLEKANFSGVWGRVGAWVQARPAAILLSSVAVMAPFVVVAVVFHGNLSYGLLSELPHDKPSVVGAQAVQAHFVPGVTGPVTVLLQNPNVDFGSSDGRRAVGELVGRLKTVRQQLHIEDILSTADPFGISLRAQKRFKEMSLWERRGIQRKAMKHYVSDVGEWANDITRIDVVFQDDPFSRESIHRLDQLEQELGRLLPPTLAGSKLLFVGPTASIRDLKAVTGRDQIRIDLLVIAAVFVVLVALFRTLAISAYLVVTVFFSYLVAIGVTYCVFWMLDPAGFAGLDWKVPMFLFTILIAVGEDYNIFLMTRVEEEQREYGPTRGVIAALCKTGSIIPGCGLIMAGTFSSLLAGSLTGMNQLGFALAFGVLLDTFVVRPILVPAYLILLHTGRFGAIGRFLGAAVDSAQEPAPPESMELVTDRQP
jgi:RND superfamily putative drug exporter